MTQMLKKDKPQKKMMLENEKIRIVVNMNFVLIRPEFGIWFHNFNRRLINKEIQNIERLITGDHLHAV